MPTGADWKKSVSHLTIDEIRKYHKAIDDLSNWGMFQYEYIDQLQINSVDYFLRRELEERIKKEAE